MRAFLLCSTLCATIVGFAAPAVAFDPARRGIMPAPLASASSVRVHRSGGDFGRVEFGERRDRHDRRRGGDFVYWGEREYQGDTAWRSDSFNDWWHSRPERSMPRWLGANGQTCERMYSTGAGWRC